MVSLKSYVCVNVYWRGGGAASFNQDKITFHNRLSKIFLQNTTGKGGKESWLVGCRHKMKFRKLNYSLHMAVGSSGPGGHKSPPL